MKTIALPAVERRSYATISAAAHEIQYSGPVDEVAAAIAWHDGDVRATIRTLLGDCRHLREQLALAEISMSVGFARGWRPKPIPEEV